MKKAIFFVSIALFSITAYAELQTLYIVSQYSGKNVETGEEAGYRPAPDMIELDVQAKTAKWGGVKFKLGNVKKSSATTYYPLLYSDKGSSVHTMTLKITGSDMLSFPAGAKESAATKYKIGTKEEYNKARVGSGGMGGGFNKAVQSVGNLFKKKDKKADETKDGKNSKQQGKDNKQK